MPLSPWQNFYVIVGSSAGALTGLQFVVITLIAQTRAAADMSAIRAFATPTVIHFCSTLFIAAVMTMPWPNIMGLAACLLIGGLAGVIYSVRVIRHARASHYDPDREDWLWYAGFPIAAHLTLLAVACLMWWYSPAALFVLAADTLVFLLIGIHNAWDSVTYMVVEHSRRTEKSNH